MRARPIRSTRWLLPTLLATALTIRLAIGLSRPADEHALLALPDQREYLELGRSLLDGRGLVMVDPRFDAEVRAFRTPGYPLLVAAMGGQVGGVRVVQSILDTLTVLAAYLLARRFFSNLISTLAAAGVAMDPLLAFFSSLVLTETLSAALVTWSLVLLAWGRSPTAAVGRRREHGMWWAGVAVLMFCVHVRPSLLPLVVALPLASLLLRQAVRSPRRPPVVVLGLALGLVALCVVTLVPWALRNRLVLGETIWTTTNTGFTAYDGLNPSATGASDQRFTESMPILREMSEAARSRYLADRATAWAIANPLRVAELALIKTARTWSPIPLSAEHGSTGNRIIAAVHAVPLLLMCLIALASRLPLRVKIFLIAPAVLITLMHAVSVGSIRYRLPAQPALCVLAAAGVAAVIPRAVGRRLDGDCEQKDAERSR